MAPAVTDSPIFSRAPLETPNLFASYRIGDCPLAGLRLPPWDMTGTQAILVNAYDLLANHRTRQVASEIPKGWGNLHEHIQFAGPLILDSGGFNFQKHADISIKPLDVLNLGIDFGVDVSVVLDHPFLPKSVDKEVSIRWKNTLANTRIMFDEFTSRNGKLPNGFQLMPVLHGHDNKTLERCREEIVNIWGGDPPIVGIGSLAPLARNGSKRTVIDILCTARQLFPDAHIHCFSLGSAMLMLFAFYCGADTVDSQTWILSAAFKNVQLPGFPWTRFSPREKEKDEEKYEQTRHAFAQHLLQLITKEGFAIKDWDTENAWHIRDEAEALSYLDYLEDRDGINHIHRRACHNLYAFNFEARRAREAKKAGELKAFIASRLKSTVYGKAFEYAVKQVQSSTAKAYGDRG